MILAEDAKATKVIVEEDSNISTVTLFFAAGNIERIHSLAQLEVRTDTLDTMKCISQVLVREFERGSQLALPHGLAHRIISFLRCGTALVAVGGTLQVQYESVTIFKSRCYK